MKKKKTKQSRTEIKISEWQKEAEKEIAESEQDIKIEMPEQTQFFKAPARFGNIPVDKLPKGCDENHQYKKIYPKISLPFQVAEKISFGHKELEPNQLIFGDNLHVMRALPSNSIDLIYLDPPFFSGRNYNIVFGDQNEVRSFVDIWEGGLDGYLIWLNARLLEMKRLLKPNGSIYVHLDWHASHYVKIELDKMFGYETFRNELVWKYFGPTSTKKNYPRKHDIILFYTKGKDYYFDDKATLVEYDDKAVRRYDKVDEEGKKYKIYYEKGGKVRKAYLKEGKPTEVFNIPFVQGTADERIGYPTQKPEDLLRRLILASSKPGDVVADFFCGGGTTPAVAQKLGRRWIAADISKIAVSVTRDRILRYVSGKNGDSKEVQQKIEKTPDIEIKNWGVYEVPEIVKMNEETFRNFIISAYNGNLASFGEFIHGYKNKIPIFVGSPSQEKPITEKEVVTFAKHIVKTREHHQGTMIAWGFTQGAKNAAQQLAAEHSISIDFVKLQLIPIESQEFKAHIIKGHEEYKNLLKFILPPQVRITTKRLNALEYEFDVSESVSLNPTGKIINVQWDFSYNGERFISTSGYSFLGMKSNKPVLKTSYKFKNSGKKKIACKVQDDEGGEKIEIMELNVK